MKGKHGIDLVLVNPGSRRQAYQSLGSDLAAIEPPIWAGLMAAFIRRHGLSVAILDANAEGLGPGETARRIVDMNPLLTSVVAYGHHPSASTQNMPSVGALCASLKGLDPRYKVILVGGHVAALPERTLVEEACDYVSGGEGLYTMLDLLDALKSDRPEDLEKVRDLWYRKDGAIAVGPPAPLVTDLDAEMPSVAWELLDMSRYRAHNWHCFGDMKRNPYGAFYTTLGCPFHCSFCCIQAPFRRGEKASGMSEGANSYRLWSPGAVLAQIDLLVQEHGVRNIKIADELFVLKPGHVKAICDGIIERGYDLNIWAYARVDTVKPDMIERLRRAGITWLAFGIEAASERVRDDSRKGYRHGKIFSTLEAVRGAGINVIGNYIFGLPEDDLETMQQTLDLAVELNCEFGNFYCAMAYPGSRLYSLALEEGWALPESWSGYSQLSVDCLPLPTRHVSAAHVLRFRDEAFRTYHTSPRYLTMIEEKFGKDTADHVREMAERRLERNLLEGV